MNNLKANLQNICSRVESACALAGRQASEITILAVSKRHSAANIRRLHDLGQIRFGESYVQEAIAKQELLKNTNIEWHFIGPVQSNKTRELSLHFQWVQSVDRKKILDRLSKQRPSGLGILNICLQVNIDEEPQKAGLMPEAVEEMAQYASELPNLRLRGLMAIPKQPKDGQDGSQSFRQMRRLFERLRTSGYEMDTLSMGMSADLESAIVEGSTMIRIGTALLGPRNESIHEEN